MEYILQKEDMELLCGWYQQHQRALPWRNTHNPYDIWISEIMLQQTRIEAVRPKYLKFKEELPDIQALAQCDDDHLMRLWEGLGYYSRARSLKKCALILVEQYQAELPRDYDALLHLPGIGPYTAGAIASIAFNMPVPAVDGNVMRVLSRYFEIHDDNRDPKLKKRFENIIQTALCDNPSLSASFNQAIMELGETVCSPNGQPHCSECPLSSRCQAFAHHSETTLPYRSSLKKRKIIDRTLFIIRDGDTFLLHKRPSTGLLADLYEFPGVEGSLSASEILNEAGKLGIESLRIRKLPSSCHIFTHLEWHMTAYEITAAQLDSFSAQDYIRVTKKELSSKAVPSAFKTYIDWYHLRD